MAQIQSNITWKTHEHHRTDHGTDWYWAVAIIALGVTVLAIYFSNILFAIVILLGAFTAILYAHSKPQEITVTLYRKGVRIDNILYPFNTLESFWVEDVEQHGKDQLIIKSRKFLMQHIIIPIPESVDPDEIEDFLLDYIEEEEMEEPFSHKIMEFLGF